ncbi:MAG: CysB family HTH-type transcriptional regulator [Pseudomonadota bacterium]
MKLLQLRYICAIADHGLNVSDVAERMHATQPGISTHVRQLEEELGVKIFERSGKRLVAVTEPGRRIIDMARRILREADNIQAVGAEFADEQHGTLTISTTHTQARYMLPRQVQAFLQKYPHVRLNIHQGSPAECARQVLAGEADFAIATEALHEHADLVVLPCYRWNRVVVTPPGHPLLSIPTLTLEALAQYPIITYDYAFTGRALINKAFAEHGLEPNIVLTAMDSDVIKTYVELGLGVGVLAKMAYDPERDTRLCAIDAAHLFEYSTTNIGIRRGKYLRGYMYDFIALFAQGLTPGVIDNAMHGHGT